MTHTELMIQEMADAMVKGLCSRQQYVEALRSIAKLGAAEERARPILAAKADMDRVAQILEQSKY